MNTTVGAKQHPYQSLLKMLSIGKAEEEFRSAK
jgi:aspartate carbamoyltransferase catalytic subunit